MLVLETLCLVDRQSKTLFAQRLNSLQSMAQAITQLMVSKRKQVQADYFEQIFRITNKLIVVLDPTFKVKESNKAFKKRYNFRKRR